MNKKLIVPLLAVLFVFVGVGLLAKSSKVSSNTTVNSNAPLKEFSMTSYTDIIDGKYHPNFSVKEITVNKGDRVKIKITEVSGVHNFNIDEYGINVDTPLNQEVVVDFTADKAGEFVYYCSKPGHRQNGHWGTLKVL